MSNSTKPMRAGRGISQCLCIVLSLLSCGVLSAQNQAHRVRNIVLVHGAWADGSGWKGVYDILAKDGYKVSIVQKPETSFKEDVTATKRILALQDGPCILVAHSYGGAAAALEAEWNKNKANMDALFSPTVPPLERFDRYFDYVHDRLAELQEKCGSILGCALLSIASEVSTQDEGVPATVDRIWDRTIKYFESAIRDAHAQGLIEAPDPEAKAKALFACYHGTLAQARIENDVELIRDFKEVARDLLGVKHEQAASS